MFYILEPSGIRDAVFSEIGDGKLSIGYITSDELKEFGRELGFSDSNIESCQYASANFRSLVEMYPDYIFSMLRIVDPSDPYAADDCVALFIKKDILLVVEVMDHDQSIRERFINVVNRGYVPGLDLERVTVRFLRELLEGSVQHVESIGRKISSMEEEILGGKPQDDFNLVLLNLKKKLRSLHNYFGQLMDVTESCMHEDEGIFPDGQRLYMANLDQRIVRIQEEVDGLYEDIIHVQEAYNGYLDMKMNDTMKYLTVLTTIFFPLTIIVGWYGMNFDSILEFHWKYGYVYVIALSLAVVAVFTWIAKKKKWW